MNLFEKIKVNVDYLLGKADPSIYAQPYKGQTISSDEWQKRVEIFSINDCFIWYGVDSAEHLAEFSANETYVSEAFSKMPL